MIVPTKIVITDSFHIVFFTGDAGYIGSKTCLYLLNAKAGVKVFDNLCNSHPLALVRVAQITSKKPTLVEGDIIQECATFGTALRPTSASEFMHFVGPSQWVSRFISRWPITITMWQVA